MKTIIYYLHRGDKIPFYVGKTTNLKTRLNTHKSVFGKSIYIEYIDKVDDWKYWEKHYINLFKNLGYILENKNNGGGGPSEGVVFPEERKQKIGQANKGTVHSLEGRLATSKKLKGRKFTAEHSSKISAAKQNHPSYQNRKNNKQIYQKDLTGNIIKEWNTIKEASSSLELSEMYIIQCCKGKREQYKNYKWEYK